MSSSASTNGEALSLHDGRATEGTHLLHAHRGDVDIWHAMWSKDMLVGAVISALITFGINLAIAYATVKGDYVGLFKYPHSSHPYGTVLFVDVLLTGFLNGVLSSLINTWVISSQVKQGKLVPIHTDSITHSSYCGRRTCGYMMYVFGVQIKNAYLRALCIGVVTTVLYVAVLVALLEAFCMHQVGVCVVSAHAFVWIKSAWIGCVMLLGGYHVEVMGALNQTFYQYQPIQEQQQEP